MSEQRARDVLSTLTRRRTAADRIIDRVGFRAWKRPNVAMSGRIFRLYRLQDPFDPESPLDEAGVALGPVALRLGENKRQPAPHAQPKQPKKPGSPSPRPEQARPPTAAPSPTPPQKPRPTPAVPPPVDESGRPQLGYIPKEYEPKPGAGKKLHQPVRPTPPPKPASAPPPQPARPAPVPASGRVTPPKPTSPPERVEHPDRPGLGYIPKQYEPKAKTSASSLGSKPSTKVQPKLFNTADRPGLVGKLPVRPDAALPAHVQQAMADRQVSAAPVAVKKATVASNEAWRRPPMPALGAPKGGGRGGSGGGRVSLGPATVVVVESQEPEVEEIVRAPSVVRAAPAPREVEAARAPEPVRVEPALPVEAPRPAPKPPPPAASSLFDDELAKPPPPPPRPKAPPGSVPRANDGLDDLFAASLNEGRMRIGKAKAVTGTVAAEEGTDKARRAPVALPKAVLPAGLPKPKDEP